MKRRTLILSAPVLAVGGMGSVGRTVSAQGVDLQPLTESARAAQALHYAEDASKADPEHYPQGSGQRCSNCLHFKGGNQSRGGCALFPGKSVSASGWCVGWVSAET